MVKNVIVTRTTKQQREPSQEHLLLTKPRITAEKLQGSNRVCKPQAPGIDDMITEWVDVKYPVSSPPCFDNPNKNLSSTFATWAQRLRCPVPRPSGSPTKRIVEACCRGVRLPALVTLPSSRHGELQATTKDSQRVASISPFHPLKSSINLVAKADLFLAETQLTKTLQT